jgi:hypothetical protein
VKGKSIKTTLSIIAGLAMLMILGAGCTGTLNADPLKDAEYPLFVEKFAERFNLDPDEIIVFMEELKEEKKTEMETKYEERLDELVENEDITGDQKQAILDKMEEMESFKESLEDMTVAEAREVLKNKKQELKDWAEENDLELKYLFPKALKKQDHKGFSFFGFGGKR